METGRVAAERRRGSRTETKKGWGSRTEAQKKPATGSTTAREEKRIGAGTRTETDGERQKKKLQKQGRGRNETTWTGSWDRKQRREGARVGTTAQSKPHSYTLQGKEGRLKK